MIYPGQYHGIEKPSYVRDRLERYLAWYDRYTRLRKGGDGGSLGDPLRDHSQVAPGCHHRVMRKAPPPRNIPRSRRRVERRSK